MNLSAEQIQANWEKHLKIVDTFITGDRKSRLKDLYTVLSEEMIMAPASGKPSFHNAFPGGYIDHVNRVVHCALKVKALWEEMGTSIDFTDEELVFAALNHDLGKIGYKDQPNYLPQTDQWRKDKLGEIYTHNAELPFMLIQDRSLFLLQKNRIEMSEKEFLAIKLHDGLYDDVNKPYYITFNPDSKLRTNLVYILHQADFLASKIEYDRWKNTQPAPAQTPVKTRTSTGKPAVTSPGLAAALKAI
jgi:hypothetical protein